MKSDGTHNRRLSLRLAMQIPIMFFSKRVSFRVNFNINFNDSHTINFPATKIYILNTFLIYHNYILLRLTSIK